MSATADEVSEAQHRRLAYLPALDGIRAFAVAAVVIYHGGPFFATGGFLGVDTFFVLSGFLITSLLISEWMKNLAIKLSAFWARRARRLLPALFLMMLLVAFYASVVVSKGTYPGLRLDALSTLLYVSNWHFILVNSNYFAETAKASPLLHTWSLAVEEQFYLVWPLVVLAIMKFTRSLKVLFGVCCTLAVASAIEMDILFHNGASTNRLYLGTDTRSQCLFIGCALAVGLVLLTKRSHAGGRLKEGELWRPSTSQGRTICAVAGVIGAALSIVLWTTTSTTSGFPYEGGFFLIGLATAGVIAAVVGAPRSLVPRFLSLAPIRYIGRISYGIYIWHWPLIIWMTEARMGFGGAGLFLVRCVVTLAVSIASYHLVEQPIRRGTFLREWRTYLVVPAAVAVVVVATVASTVGAATGVDVGSGTIPPPITATTSTTPPGAPTTSPAAAPVRVLLFGDSVALTLGIGLGTDTAMESKYDYSLSDEGILGCGVVDGPEVELMGVRYQTPEACNGSTQTSGVPLKDQPWPYQWLSAMAKTQPNVVVLLAGRWEVADREYQGKWTNILNPAFAAYVKSQLEASSALVTASGAHMVFLTAPCTDEGEQPDGAPWPEDNPARLAIYNGLVREVAAENPTTDSVVDLDAVTCPGGKFTTDIDGVAVRRSDGVHFTDAAGPVLGPKIMPAIVAAGRAQIAATTSTTTAP
ncbi:MAG TPA: acyltransferase family protein [Acidimicrobiales bacterium]|jgi:peptidoglycan/LPS O-acetylase OafA/YrhL